MVIVAAQALPISCCDNASLSEDTAPPIPSLGLPGFGLSLARYSLLMLDEPTNHLDMNGKAALAETLSAYAGGVLLVSHDRQLISRCCNRFWVIHNGMLEICSDADSAWQCLRASSPGRETDNVPLVTKPASVQADVVLAQLVALEALLAQDVARKPGHQKPQRQQQWLRRDCETLRAAG